MKKILFILFAPVFLLFACDEIAPVINPQMDVVSNVSDLPVDVDNQMRQVLIEEFTGVRCVNCPAGAEEIKGILEANGTRVVAVSIHAGEFSPPYTSTDCTSLYDFRSTDADGIFSLLGPPFAYPSSAINRKRHGTSSNIIVIGKDNWSPIVTDELAEPLTAKIGIAHIYNADSSTLEISARIFPQVDILDEDVRLTVLITENHIEDYQLTEMGKQADYEHEHVLRDAITAPEGNLITESLTAGVEIERVFAIDFPAEWNADNCDIVAILSKGGTDKDVLQVEAVQVVE